MNREELVHEAITEKKNNSRIKKQLYDSMSHQRPKMDIEINELWVWMNRTPKRRYKTKKKTTKHKVQLIEEDYINKTSGWQQNVVWDPRVKEWYQFEDNKLQEPHSFQPHENDAGAS